MAAVIIYYFVNNPWPVGHIIKSLFGMLFVIAASFGTGKKITNLLKLEAVTFIEELSVSIGIGLGVVSIIMMLMGSLKMYYSFYAYVMLIALIIISLKDIVSWWKTGFEKSNKYSSNRFSVVGAVFLIILVFCLGVAFMSSIVPPVNDYGISVSLATAKKYIINGGFYKLSSNYIANLPSGMLMLQVLGLLLYGSSVSKLISFLFFALLAVGVYSMTRKFFHRKIALFAAAITVSTPFIVKVYLIDHPIIASIFYSFMALYCFVCWTGNSQDIENKYRGWLVASGMFTAFSVSAGFYSMFTPLVLLIMIMYKILASKKDSESDEPSVILMSYMLPVIIFLIPAFLKNLSGTGNPFFPLFSSDIKHMGFDIQYAKSLFGYLLPLWYVPFEGELSMKNFFYLGPVFMVFLPGLFLIKEIGKAIQIIFSYIGIYLIIFIIAGRKLMFMYSLIPVMSIMLAYIIINLYGQKKYFYNAVIGVFFISIGINFYSIWPWLDIKDRIDAVIGYTSAREYLEQHVQGYPVMDYINKNTSKDSKILLVGESRSFYIDRKIISNDLWSKDVFAQRARKADSVSDLKDKLKYIGVTHLLVNVKAVDKLRKYHSYAWDLKVGNMFDLLTGKYVELKFKESNYCLYEL
jgi:hypothetical protein